MMYEYNYVNTLTSFMNSIKVSDVNFGYTFSIIISIMVRMKNVRRNYRSCISTRSHFIAFSKKLLHTVLCCRFRYIFFCLLYISIIKQNNNISFYPEYNLPTYPQFLKRKYIEFMTAVTRIHCRILMKCQLWLFFILVLLQCPFQEMKFQLLLSL